MADLPQFARSADRSECRHRRRRRARWRQCGGACRRGRCAARAQRRFDVRRGAAVQPLQRPARGRPGGGPHDTLPAPSRLLQPAQRRGAARAGAGPARLLARGTCPRVAFVRERLPAATRSERFQVVRGAGPDSVVIVGGGAAGLAAAEMLRRAGYERPVTILSADDSAPVDRPNLSKDYLAGTAAEEWIPLRTADFYAEHKIELLLNAKVDGIDVEHRSVRLSDGRTFGYGALLIATGADPIQLQIDGAQSSQVHYLRSFADSRSIIAGLGTARRAIVVGASFIGLEVAASLRERGLEVHVVGLEKVPMERVLGPELGALRAIAARGARRDLPSRRIDCPHRRRDRDPERRRARAGRDRRHRRRGPARAVARRARRPRARPRRGRRPLP